MALQPSIILSGQTPDIVNTLARSTQAAGLANQNQRRNALADTYRQHGPGIMAGDKDALNALAQVDTPGAVGIQQSQQAGSRAEQEFNMKVQQYKSGISSAQAKAEAEEIKRGVLMGSGAQTPEQWDQVMTGLGQTDLVGQFDNKDMLLRQYMTAAQILEADKGPDPLSPAGKLKADLDAGRITPEQFNAASQKSGMRVTSDGKGGFIFEQGVGVTGGQKGPEDPSSTSAMINSIDGILNDPALEYSTGLLSPLQNVPGTPMKRFQGRANQLNGQAFLQAFDSLRGTGQITEIEGAKATQAIGRLDTAQSPEDYRDSLIELRSLLVVASGRPEGWVETQRKINGAGDIIPAGDVKAMTPDEIRALGPDGLLRVPASELTGLSDEQWDALESLAGEQ